MATITPVRNVPLSTNHMVVYETWGNLTGSDTAQPVELANFADRSVQVLGVFDGASVAVQGSLLDDPTDPAGYVTLTDPQGNPLTFTSNKIESVMEVTRWLKPVVTNATASTSLTVIVLVKGHTR
jgi:hypothetical protein